MIMAFNSYALRPLSEKTTVMQKMGQVKKKDRVSLKVTLRFDGCHENKHVGRPAQYGGGRPMFRFALSLSSKIARGHT